MISPKSVYCFATTPNLHGKGSFVENAFFPLRGCREKGVPPSTRDPNKVKQKKTLKTHFETLYRTKMTFVRQICHTTDM